MSSAEAELYGMVEGVTRAKGLVSLARELGFKGLPSTLRLGTDSSAAKSFVCRRGFGQNKAFGDSRSLAPEGGRGWEMSGRENSRFA